MASDLARSALTESSDEICGQSERQPRPAGPDARTPGHGGRQDDAVTICVVRPHLGPLFGVQRTCVGLFRFRLQRIEFGGQPPDGPAPADDTLPEQRSHLIFRVIAPCVCAEDEGARVARDQLRPLRLQISGMLLEIEQRPLRRAHLAASRRSGGGGAPRVSIHATVRGAGPECQAREDEHGQHRRWMPTDHRRGSLSRAMGGNAAIRLRSSFIGTDP
jgi:hypothetical protein